MVFSFLPIHHLSDADDYRCICTSDYEGDFCENPNCQNGATMDSFRCLCASGYTGQFCQYGSCDTWNFMETNDVRETDFKQVTKKYGSQKASVNICVEH